MLLDDSGYGILPLLADGCCLEDFAKRYVIVSTSNWFADVTRRSWNFSRKQGSAPWLLDSRHRKSSGSAIFSWLTSLDMKHGAIFHLGNAKPTIRFVIRAYHGFTSTSTGDIIKSVLATITVEYSGRSESDWPFSTRTSRQEPPGFGNFGYFTCVASIPQSTPLRPKTICILFIRS
jgi:hypothetical protein